MPRFSREQPKRMSPMVFLFPVVMGLVGWFVLSRNTPDPLIAKPVPITSASVTVVSSTRVLLGRAKQGADRDEEYVYDVNAQTLVATSTPVGWRLPLISSASLTRRTEDSVWLLQAPEWSVALRDARGNAYQDPLLVGPFDEAHFAVAAIASNRRMILSVSRAGVIRELLSLSEQTVPLTMQDGKVWLVEAAPQEGIEMPPHGPSSVWSVNSAGATSTRITDDRVNALVTYVVVKGSDVAFTSDQNDVRMLGPQGLDAPIAGKPLGWLPDHRLLLQQNGRLCVAVIPSTVTCGSTVPDGLVWVGIVP